MQMIDVLKRLAELDAANPTRPEYVATSEQNISTTLSESVQVDECGMMPEMGSMDRPSTPASINMTAGSGEELGELIKAIATLAGAAGQNNATPLSAAPTMATTSPDGMDMRAMIDKLNPMDDEEEEEEETDESYDNTPSDPTDTNEFDSEEFAHHENPPGAAKGRGLQNHPIAVPTMEQMEQQLYADYQNFVVESVDDEMGETRGFRGVGGRRDREDDEHWGSGYKKPVGKWTPAVFIDGKKWKTFSDKAEAQRVAAAVSKKYPDKHVSVQDTYVSESSVEEGFDKTIWVKPSSNHTLIVVKSSSPDIEAGEEYDEGDLNNYANDFGYEIKDQGVAEGYEDNKAAAAKAPSAAERAKSRDAQRSSAAKKARMDAQKKGTWQDKDGTGYGGKKPAK